MQNSLLHRPVPPRNADHIIKFYGWNPTAYVIVTYWDESKKIDDYAQIEAVEVVLMSTVNGRYFLDHESFYCAKYDGVEIRIHFECEEDAMMFKLAWS